MAQITFNIPDAVAPRVVDALASKYQYDRYEQVTIDRGLTPMTKLQFIKKQIMTMFKNTVAEYESRQALVELSNQVKQTVNRDIDIT
jgi:hypothetical protein